MSGASKQRHARARHLNRRACRLGQRPTPPLQVSHTGAGRQRRVCTASRGRPELAPCTSCSLPVQNSQHRADCARQQRRLVSSASSSRAEPAANTRWHAALRSRQEHLLLLTDQHIDRAAAQCRRALSALWARGQAAALFLPQLAARHRLKRLQEAASASPSDGARCVPAHQLQSSVFASADGHLPALSSRGCSSPLAWQLQGAGLAARAEQAGPVPAGAGGSAAAAVRLHAGRGSRAAAGDLALRLPRQTRPGWPS